MITAVPSGANQLVQSIGVAQSWITVPPMISDRPGAAGQAPWPAGTDLHGAQDAARRVAAIGVKKLQPVKRGLILQDVLRAAGYVSAATTCARIRREVHECRVRTFLQHAHAAAVCSLACGARLKELPLPRLDLLRVRGPAIPLCLLLCSCRPALLRI